MCIRMNSQLQLQLSSETMDLIDPSNGISTDNMRFLQLMTKKIVMVKGHYQIILLLKDLNINFLSKAKAT